MSVTDAFQWACLVLLWVELVRQRAQLTKWERKR